jgi:hypothetical protein
VALLRDYYDWRPSPSQELLLKAALRQGRQCQLAWEALSPTLDLGRLDQGSRRLLPLLYQNLRVERIALPAAAQFKRLYLDTWAKNKFLFARISPVLQEFHAAGINTLVLKGVALVVRYYKDFGLRPMSDFDLLVPTEQAGAAIALLRRLDWTPELETPDKSLGTYLSVNYALSFSNPARVDIDLHWHAFSECRAPAADQDFWAGAVTIQVGGVRTLCLNATDELFHTCIHGARWNKMPPIRWVADALTILNSGEAIDWHRLGQQASQRRLTLPLKDTLSYLEERFAAPIPSEFVDDLNQSPVSRMEVNEYRARTRRPGWSSYIPFLWAYYPRFALDTGRSPGWFGFLKYLQSFWELGHVWQVPFYASWRSLKRLFGIPSD